MIKKALLSLFVLLSVVACSNSGGSGSEETKDTFDRNAMLTNWSDNIIIPALQDLNTKLEALVASKDSFVATPNQDNLVSLRDSWLNAYKTWQWVEMFNIGKAEELMYFEQMNIYPTSVTDITNNITNGNYDITHVNNHDAVGFPAVDYLLYGLAATNNELLAFYTSHENAQGYKKYLSDLVNQMQHLTKTVLTDWTTNYKSVFVANTGNSATGSVSKLINDYIFYYEKGLRANKIGIPAGIFSSNPLPEKVEAYYNKEVSKQLTLEALKAFQDFFNGKAYGASTSGKSLEAYLKYLKTIKEGEDLSVLINNQINTARAKVQELNANFASQISTDNTKMLQAYDELQKVVVLLKTDMTLAMNVSIDYVDADGD